MRKSSLFIELSAFAFIVAIVILIAISIIQKANFEEILHLEHRVVHLLQFSITQALLSTIFSIFLGVIFAWALHYRREFFGRDILIALISSSLVLPSLIVVFGIIGVYGRNGWLGDLTQTAFGSIYGLKGIVLAHVYLNSSFATKALLHSLESISFERYKLSASLNFNLWERFIHIELRAMAGTIKSIFVTIFLLCFASFAIVLLLGGGPQNSTLEVAIYEAIRIDYDINSAIKYTIIQLFISIALITLSQKEIEYAKTLKSKYSELGFLEKPSHKVLQYLLIIFFTIFFILPLLVVISDGLKGSIFEVIKDKLFVKSLLTSLLIATISSILSVIFTLLLADLRREFTLKKRFKKSLLLKIFDIFITLVSNIYLSVSSLIFGLGFFLLALKFQISQHLMAWFALIVVNILLTLPFSLSVVYPIVYKIGIKYDRLIKSLQLSWNDEWKKINLPHLKGAIIYIFCLSFCFSLGDLGIIALFGDEDFTTLPWYLYGLMGSYQNTKASVVALLMLILTLSIFLSGEYIARDKRS